MKRLLISILVIPLAACFGPSKEENELVEKNCSEFVEKEMNGQYQQTKVFDTYSKKGKVVVEVGYKDRHSSGDSYSVRLCVVDFDKGTLSSPSPLNDSEWKK